MTGSATDTPTAEGELSRVGDRVWVRRLTADDAPAMAKLRSENRGFFQPFEPMQRDSWYTTEAQAADLSVEGKYRLGIFDRGNEKLVGWVTLSCIERGAWQNCNLGYSVDQSENGKGFATEAVGLAVSVAFDDLELHRVQAAVMPSNGASIRVLAKKGFRCEGFAPNYLNLNGAWRDHGIYAITAPVTSGEAPRSTAGEVAAFQRSTSDDAACDTAKLTDLERELSTTDDPAGCLRLTGQIAELRRGIGHPYSDAVSASHDAAELAREIGDGCAEAANLVRLATALQYDGQHARAVETFGEVIDRRSDAGFETYWHFAQQHLGKCLVEMGQLDQAHRCFDAALQERQRLGNEGWLASTRRALDGLAALVEERRPR